MLRTTDFPADDAVPFRLFDLSAVIASVGDDR